MGMFDKSKLYDGVKLTDWAEESEEFILWDCAIVAEKIPMEKGEVAKSALNVSKPDTPTEVQQVTSINAAIAAAVSVHDQGRDNKSYISDLPAVVKWESILTKAGNRATVLKPVGPYNVDHEAPQQPEFERLTDAQVQAAVAELAENIPF